MRLAWVAVSMLAMATVGAQAQDAVAVRAPGSDAVVQQGDAPAVQSGHVDVEGGRLFYEVAGEGNAVVLLHDGLLHRASWDGQFTVLARSYRVLRYDRRGYGLSTTPEAPFSHIRDLDAVLTALGIESAVLVGCSSGGELAIDYTLAHPERVRALLLIGPIVTGMPFTKHFSTRGGRFFPTEQTTLDEVIEFFSNVDPYGIAPENVEAKARANALLRECPQNLNWAAFQLAEPPERTALPNLGEIAVPTVIVVGEFDIPDVHAHCGAIEAGIPNATRLVFSHSGHLVHFEQPAAFNEILLGFLTSLFEAKLR